MALQWSSIQMLFLLLIAFNASSTELLITNARIIDGSGKAAFDGQLLIDNGRIQSIESSHKQLKAQRVIDAQGKVVAPGFIDLHAHGNPLTHGQFKNFLAMGVTTIALGQDGSSPGYKDIRNWYQQVEKLGSSVNIAMFAGHGTLRRELGFTKPKALTEKQLNKLGLLLQQNLPFVFGLSTGLEYVPGMYADIRELEYLAKLTGKYDRLISSHLRNEDDDKLNGALQELVTLGKYSRVHVSHLKSVYGKGKMRAEQILNILTEARSAGIKISADVYPYMASYTGISLLFPKWAKTPSQLKQVLPNRRKELEAYLRKRVNSRNGPQATLLGTGSYKGQTLAQLARKFDMPFENVLIDKLGNSGHSAAYFIMDEQLQDELIISNFTTISSDGSPTMHHPRGHGSFAKIVSNYVVDKGQMTLEQAVSKMTYNSAAILKLSDRGLIKPGYLADVVIFDPESVKVNASYSKPRKLSSGFDWVIVNGKIAKEYQQFSTQRFGAILRPN